MDDLAAKLDARRAQGLYRQRQTLSSPQGVRVRMGDETLLSFCSNDYLGLANDPRVVRAFRAAAAEHGVGAGASHLITGHHAVHAALEEELADFVGAERALLFSTGYMANLGVVSALTDRDGVIFEDKLNHASLIDAARLARAKVRRYPHIDTTWLAQRLAAEQGSKLVTTDGVFSMDGDIAPLRELHALTRRYGARLLVDDAHGLGVLGNEGRGSCAVHGITVAAPVILMGTLGKAFGVFGAFVAAEQPVIETLIQHARTYIYTTALPMAVAAAVRESLRIVRAEPWRREHLQALVQRFAEGAGTLGLRLLNARTPIQPVLLGNPDAALTSSRQLRARGILVPAIRPPTVPVGTSRLRITLSAAHQPADVDRLLENLATVLPPRAS